MAYSTQGRKEICTKKFWLGNLKENNHFEDLGTDRMVILNWVLLGWCSLILLAKDRDKVAEQSLALERLFILGICYIQWNNKGS